MNKQPIERHKHSLYNMVEHLARLNSEIVTREGEARRLEQRISTLREQIQRAEKECRVTFDSDRYNMPKKRSIK